MSARFVPGSLVACALAITCRAQLPGLVINGNPETFPGATWSYQQTVDGITYDLTGILRKPMGPGPFPAVIVNHGTGGNANGYSRTVANEMVTWGYVGIGANLTHSGGVPCGAPGDCVTAEYGSSPANILRAMKCRDILASLGYADTLCIAAFGHSRGAWLTTGLVAAHPDKFAVAGHTAGGVNDDVQSTAPSTFEAASIACPYILQHGDADATVPVEWDILLDSVLTANSIPHDLIIFPGYTHAQIAQDPMMYANVHDWFDQHACAITTQAASVSTSAETAIIRHEVFELAGRIVDPMSAQGPRFSELPNGIFIIREHLADGRIRVRRVLVVEGIMH